MNKNTTITKSNGIKDLFSGYSNSNVEERSVFKSDMSNLSEVLADWNKFINTFGEGVGLIPDFANFVLSPTEISKFLELSTLTEIGIIYDQRINDYATKLIKKSYDDGNNNFYIDFSKTPYINNFGTFLKAEEKRTLNLKIDGQVGSFFCNNSSNLNVYVNGSVGGYFGRESRNINISVDGPIGGFFGVRSHNINAKIQGRVGSAFGEGSRNLKVIIEGDVDVNFGYLSKGLVGYVTGEVLDSPLRSADRSTLFIPDKTNLPNSFTKDYKSLIYLKGNQIFSGDKISTHTKYQQLQRIMEEKF